MIEDPQCTNDEVDARLSMSPLTKEAVAIATPRSISPSSSSSADLDSTPLAVEPLTLHKVYLEGIPEHLGGHSSSSLQHDPQQPTTNDNNKPQSSSPHAGSFEDASYESLLSSLDDEDQLSLSDESFYFTPLEEAPLHRMDRLKRELQLRTELLEYVAPQDYSQLVLQQEQVVQQRTLSAAQIKATERQRRRAERRRQRHDNKAPSSDPVTPKSLFQANPLPTPPLSYGRFEWFHGLPAVASMLLACIAHAALYELVLALVLVCLQPFLSYRILRDSDDQIVENVRDNSVEDLCYGVVLVVGLVVARCSGLIFGFDERQALEEDPHRVDGQWAQWLNTTKKGGRVKGFLDVVSFYVCLVAVMYFLGRFALCVDQRSSILEHMPSNKVNLAAPGISSGTCPATLQDVLLPMEDTHDKQWDLPACDNGELDHLGNPVVYEFGSEDEVYLYQHLSASAYHQFWGYGYRAALFDLPHQILFNLTCSVVAIYTLKRYFGCSFWGDW